MSENSAKLGKHPTVITLKDSAVRIILAATVSCLAITQSVFDATTSLSLLSLAALIIYSIGSSIWLRTACLREHKNTYYSELSILDAAVFSAALALFFHSYALSAMVFAVIAFHATVIGSWRQTLNTASTYVVSAGAVSLATSPDWGIHIAWHSALIYSIGLSVYLSVFGALVYKRFQRLNQSNQKTYADLVQNKIRSYKLSRYVSPTVWSALTQGRDASLHTERKRLTVFFSDIEGFSSLSEELEAESLTDLLNSYLTEMVKIATYHKGTIDKFMGDGLMVLFGDTNSGGMKSDCLRCVSMAIDMRKKMKELETTWFNQGIKKPLKIRMGINSGYCTVGTFGTAEYMDYTVLGTHVNLASRLESAADASEILISHETWSLIKDVVMCRDRGEINAKGFSHPIKVYQVVDFRKDLGKNQSYFEEHIQGFSMHLDLEKIKNYDRDRIVKQLASISTKLQDKI